MQTIQPLYEFEVIKAGEVLLGTNSIYDACTVANNNMAQIRAYGEDGKITIMSTECINKIVKLFD